jgi:hypothetical protein
MEKFNDAKWRRDLLISQELAATVNEEKGTLESVTTDLENFNKRLATYESKSGVHPWDPQLKMKDYIKFLKEGITRLEKRKKALS